MDISLTLLLYIVTLYMPDKVTMEKSLDKPALCSTADEPHVDHRLSCSSEILQSQRAACHS